MSNFNEFNKTFPNSTYREINPYYKVKSKDKDEVDKYQASKAPINSKVVKYNDIKNTENRIGWIVPTEYIVVDIDNMRDANILFEILKKYKTKFSFNVSKKGGHFIFKNKNNIGNGVRKPTSIGVPVDIRSQEKGYIILPHNDPDRKWGNLSNNLDEIPFFLQPLKTLKVDDDFSILGDGDGRNDKLHKHFLALKDYAPELTLEEKVESIRIINMFVLKEPLSDTELKSTVLREELVNKEPKKKKSARSTLEDLSNEIVSDKTMITCNEVTYQYNGKFYKPLDDKEIERIIHEEYDAKLFERDRKEIIKFIKLKTWVKPSELNKNWNEIVVKNGILNISSLTLQPHTPTKYNTIFINHNFIKDADYSNIIDNFFNTLANGEVNKKILLLETIGYVLLRKNVFAKFFMCVGEGQTGKSTYLTLINNLIGEDNLAFLSIQDLESTFLPIELFGKLGNIGDDVSFKGLMDTSILKKLVSGEKIIGQQKFKQPISFNNFATLIFTTNRLPNTSDKTTGFYRRLQIIEINKVIKKPDPFFLDKLTESDYEYLLFKAVEAIRGALNNGELTQCESSIENLSQFRTSQSSVLIFLKEKEYNEERMNYKVISEAYAEYKQFAEDEGFKHVSSANFIKEVCDELRLIPKNTTYKGSNQQRRFVKRGI